MVPSADYIHVLVAHQGHESFLFFFLPSFLSSREWKNRSFKFCKSSDKWNPLRRLNMPISQKKKCCWQVDGRSSTNPPAVPSEATLSVPPVFSVLCDWQVSRFRLPPQTTHTHTPSVCVQLSRSPPCRRCHRGWKRPLVICHRNCCLVWLGD